MQNLNAFRFLTAAFNTLNISSDGYESVIDIADKFDYINFTRTEDGHVLAHFECINEEDHRTSEIVISQNVFDSLTNLLVQMSHDTALRVHHNSKTMNPVDIVDRYVEKNKCTKNEARIKAYIDNINLKNVDTLEMKFGDDISMYIHCTHADGNVEVLTLHGIDL